MIIPLKMLYKILMLTFSVFILDVYKPLYFKSLMFVYSGLAVAHEVRYFLGNQVAVSINGLRRWEVTYLQLDYY